MISIGVDIGGSHISGIAVNDKNGKLLKHTFTEARFAGSENATEITEVWTDVIRQIIYKAEASCIVGIGVAIPGPFDYQQGISKILGLDKYDCLYGLNIKKALRNNLQLDPNLPINFINDAFAFGIGEAWKGEGKHAQKLIAVTLGTGFGSSFVMNGIPVVHGMGVPPDGFIYHVPYQKGIADDYISTRWFVKRFYELAGQKVKEVLDIRNSENKKEIANQLFDEFGKNIARILAKWIKEFDAECLVLGGNISKSNVLFVTALKQSLQTSGVNVDVYISTLMEESALLGCARIANPDFYDSVKKSIYQNTK